MGFQKSFRQTSDKSAYPKWVEIELTEEEEREAEKQARRQHLRTMLRCIKDAKLLQEKSGLEGHTVDLAKSLFDKQASHEVFYKERRAKQKMDEQHD
jgi:flagellar biosynthesis regulator FlbT